MAFKVPNEYRLHSGRMGSTDASGNNGAFILPTEKDGYIRMVASDGAGWEHVSVSLIARCPTWEEMCMVKKLFWGDEDCVVQYHPPKKDYINCNNYCLHMWRPVNQVIPRPPSIMVGYREGD